ncbi:NAD(P)/FAD-dependent oxidoreductase [Streptomyces gamaensis]|uniref:NAD(P)/FAD-dependent oxidoreductase n=1 Tax=Streptomyces gamaensis TaxID=1763542 RepID=A0ABW0YVC5_9ACTN
MSPRRIVVVGAGMAAARFAQQLSAATPDGEADIVLYGREPHAPYNRTRLTDVLAGRYRDTALTLATGGSTIRTGTDVVAVDPAARTLRTASGETVRYDELVLATGAAPLRARTRRAYVLRGLDDCRRLAAALPGARRALVVGGGVLGVSTAVALAARGPEVHLVHRGPYLMERHLDPGAATAVRRALEALGVTVHFGPDRPPPDPGLTVAARGVRPRTRLARAAGLAVRTGVLVDDTLATSAPGIHAIGDCAEHLGTVHGTAEAAWEQADVLAARLSGARPDACYTGSPRLLRLTAGPLEIAAFGDPAEHAAADDTVRLTDATRGTYKALALRGARLAAAVLVGDTAAAGDLCHACREHERSTGPAPDPVHLLTTRGATP